MTHSANGEKVCRRATGLQRGMLLGSTRPDGGTAYLVQWLVPLPQPIREDIFLRAVHKCLHRHAGLMAQLEFRDTELWQSELDCVQPPLPTIDASVDGEEREGRLRAIVERDRSRPLPLF